MKRGVIELARDVRPTAAATAGYRGYEIVTASDASGPVRTLVVHRFILSECVRETMCSRVTHPMIDDDLDQRSRDELVAEIRRLRDAIREHRDSSGHQLCWHQPKLWSLLPQKTDPAPTVPEWPQFLRGCIRYRQSLDEQAPGAPRMSEEFET